MTVEGALPWIGPAYETMGLDGLRALIVGESHYSDEPASETNEITQTVMEDYLRNISKYPFFNTIARILMNERTGQPASFWLNIAFINFVEKIVEQYSRPSPEDYRRSLPRFRGIVSKLQPDLVCLFSAAAWEWRPWGGEPWTEAFGSEPIHIRGSYELTGYQTSWGKPLLMARFNHPRGLGAPIDVWRAWAEKVKALAAEKCW